jgi:hypothetical protein
MTELCPRTEVKDKVAGRLEPVRRTSEYLGQDIIVATFHNTAAILLPSQGLVNPHGGAIEPTNTDQDNPHIPAMESASMSAENQPR